MSNDFAYELGIKIGRITRTVEQAQTTDQRDPSQFGAPHQPVPAPAPVQPAAAPATLPLAPRQPAKPPIIGAPAAVPGLPGETAASRVSPERVRKLTEAVGSAQVGQAR